MLIRGRRRESDQKWIAAVKPRSTKHGNWPAKRKLQVFQLKSVKRDGRLRWWCRGASLRIGGAGDIFLFREHQFMHAKWIVLCPRHVKGSQKELDRDPLFLALQPNSISLVATTDSAKLLHSIQQATHSTTSEL